MLMPLTTHTVKKGEHLTGITKKHGFPGGAWKKIYKASYNAPLRKRRPDPNVILPGDIVALPMFTLSQTKMVYDAIWEVVKVLEYAIHYEKKALAAVTKAKKNPDKVDERADQLIRDTLYHTVKDGMAADAQLKVCRKKAKERFFGDLLKSCEKAHSKRFKTIYNIENTFLKAADGAKEDAEKKRKALAALEKSLKGLIKQTKSFTDGLVAIGDLVSKVSRETF